MDITEFARLGGQARANKLSASRRKEIARNAVLIMHRKNNHTCKQVDIKPVFHKCIHGMDMPASGFGSCGVCNREMIESK